MEEFARCRSRLNPAKEKIGVGCFEQLLQEIARKKKGKSKKGRRESKENEKPQIDRLFAFLLVSSC